MRRTRQAGFTLTELVVTIVVFAVLAVVSIPSFVELRERNSLRGVADNFAATVGLAKQEAIKRGEMVRVEVQRIRLNTEPALSLVPEAREPPKGCWPTTAPVGLSLM